MMRNKREGCVSQCRFERKRDGWSSQSVEEKEPELYECSRLLPSKSRRVKFLIGEEAAEWGLQGWT